MDLYRIEDKTEIEELGLDDDPDLLLVIEWPERLGETWETFGLKIALQEGDTKSTRHITFSGGQAWAERLQKLKLIRE